MNVHLAKHWLSKQSLKFRCFQKHAKQQSKSSHFQRSFRSVVFNGFFQCFYVGNIKIVNVLMLRAIAHFTFRCFFSVRLCVLDEVGKRTTYDCKIISPSCSNYMLFFDEKSVAWKKTFWQLHILCIFERNPCVWGSRNFLLKKVFWKIDEVRSGSNFAGVKSKKEEKTLSENTFEVWRRFL